MPERSNEKALRIIGHQYDSFINLQDKWDFFRGLAEYVKTLQETPQTQLVIKTLQEQREFARKVYDQMNTDAMKELASSARKMITIAEQVVKQYKPIAEATKKAVEAVEQAKPRIEVYQTQYDHISDAVKEVQDRMAGRVISSDPTGSFERDLFEIAKQIKASGHEEAIKEFENNKKRNHNIYGNYTFSPIYEKLDDEAKKVKRKEEVEPWGAWVRMPLLKNLVYNPDGTADEFKAEADKNPAFKLTWFNFTGIAGEMEAIRSGKASDKDVVYFRVKDFRSLAQRIHTFIMTELLKADATDEDKLEFDAKKNILSFAGESIKISKRADSDAKELLQTVFKDKSKLWDNDEVLDDWKVAHDKKRVPKNKVYQAGQSVNRIVARETKIKDFLEITTKTVRISEKYLKP